MMNHVVGSTGPSLVKLEHYMDFVDALSQTMSTQAG